MKLQNDFSLKKLNTFGINVHAKHLIEIHTPEELSSVLKSKKFGTEKKLVLGGGSNLLFTKDFDGLILKVEVQGIHVVKEDPEHLWVKAGGGIVWQELVEKCIKAKLQ